MTHIETSIHIPADPETVWADVANLESHVEWMADAESIDFDGDQRRGEGVVMRVLTRVGPLTTTDVIKVTSWDPPNAIGVDHEGLVIGVGEFRLSPEGSGTRFTWEERLTIPWKLGGPIGSWFAGPLLKWIWQRNLKRLAGRFEGRPETDV